MAPECGGECREGKRDGITRRAALTGGVAPPPLATHAGSIGQSFAWMPSARQAAPGRQQGCPHRGPTERRVVSFRSASVGGHLVPLVRSALESRFASELTYLKCVLVVEALSAETLGFAMFGVLTPGLEQLR